MAERDLEFKNRQGDMQPQTAEALQSAVDFDADNLTKPLVMQAEQTGKMEAQGVLPSLSIDIGANVDSVGSNFDRAVDGAFSNGSLISDIGNHTVAVFSGMADAAKEAFGSGRRGDMVDSVDPALVSEGKGVFAQSLEAKNPQALKNFLDQALPQDGSQAVDNERVALLARLALEHNNELGGEAQMGAAWADMRTLRKGDEQDFANAEHYLLQASYGASEYKAEVATGAILPAVYDLGKEAMGWRDQMAGMDQNEMAASHETWARRAASAQDGDFSDGTMIGDIKNEAIERASEVMKILTIPAGSEPSLNQYAWQMAGFSRGLSSREKPSW